MKICFVNPTKGQRPLYMVAKKLADRGHTATILQPIGGGQRYPAWDNVQIIYLPCRYVPEVRFTVPPFRQQYELMARLVAEEGFDLIHAYDYHYLTALPPILVKKRLGVPITLTSNALVGISWFYGKYLIDQAARVYAHTVGRFILRSYDRLIFIHNALPHQLDSFLPSHPPTYVIPNGIDFERFNTLNRGKRRGLGIGENEKVLLFVGRLVVVKKFELILEVTRQLAGKGLPVKLVVVGDGSLREHYERLAALLGDKVIFVGKVPATAVKDYYAIADALVLSSRSEGLPAVVMEAAACGVPSVVSNVGGLAELVRHGETGFLYEPDDIDSFTHYTESLLTNPEMAVAMGKRARDHIWQNFNWDLIADQYEALFEQAIQASHTVV